MASKPPGISGAIVTIETKSSAVKPLEVKPLEVKLLETKPVQVTKQVEIKPVQVTKSVKVTKMISKQKTQSLPNNITNLTNKKPIATKIFKSTIDITMI